METITDGFEKNDDYTMGLAAFDGVPVALFFANGLMIYSRIKGAPLSKVFLAGVISAFAGGASKVAWKTVIAKDRKDVKILTKAFKKLLPGGLAAVTASGICSAALCKDKGKLLKAFTPVSLGCYAAGAAGMCLMGYLGSHMDDSAKSNWIEEMTNTASQAAFLAGTLTLKP